MASDKYTPLELEHLREERALRFLWADGHEANYPLYYVRGHCGCATCQGHFQPEKFISVPGCTLGLIEPVGNYAVLLNWNDGHNTGIYPFRKLRDICPCPECMPGGMPDEAIEPEQAG